MNHIQEETEKLREVIKQRATIKPYKFNRCWYIWLRIKQRIKKLKRK